MFFLDPLLGDLFLLSHYESRHFRALSVHHRQFLTCSKKSLLVQNLYQLIYTEVLASLQFAWHLPGRLFNVLMKRMGGCCGLA